MSSITQSLQKSGEVKRRSISSSGARRISSFLTFGILAFFVLVLLLFLQLYAIRLNKEVSELETQLEEVKASNDSKKGQLVSNIDLAAIEAQARALGMTEIQPNQYVYEGAAKKSLVNTSEEVGLFAFLDFFKEIRNEGKWPRTLAETQ